MKRFWIGICVLAVLLALGSGVTYFMETAHRPISHDLIQAAEAALAGDWDQALALSQNARQQWDICSDFTAAFADHSVLEEADALFAEIGVYAAAEDPVSFAAVCAQLSQLTKAIAESHWPKWQNLL